MGIQQRIICDVCKEECEYFFHIKNIVIRSANGAARSRPMGFADFEEGDVIVCSVACFQAWIGKAINRNFGGINDQYIPGDQVGIINVMDKPCGK